MSGEIDRLYQIFESHLLSGKYDNESQETFVEQVIETYLSQLHQQGHIPLRHLSGLRADLKLDVEDMLRTKTYGHFSIKSYREQYVSKLKARRS